MVHLSCLPRIFGKLPGNFQFKNIKPHAGSGSLIIFESIDKNVKFDDKVHVEWYWTYKGQTKIETELLEINKK